MKICLITGFPAYYERLLEENPEMDFTCFIKKPVSIDILIKRLKAELEIKNSGHYYNNFFSSSSKVVQLFVGLIILSLVGEFIKYNPNGST